MPHSDSILGLKRLTIAIKAGLPGYNYSTRIVGLEGGVDFFLPTPTETLYLSPKPRSRMRVEFWGQNSTRIGSERGFYSTGTRLLGSLHRRGQQEAILTPIYSLNWFQHPFFSNRAQNTVYIHFIWLTNWVIVTRNPNPNRDFLSQ